MSQILAYLGPPGTFSESAAVKYDPTARLIPMTSISSVAESVKMGTSHIGIVPIENSLEGPVNDTLDLLIQESTLRIFQELVLQIDHCLLAQPSVRIEAIQAIYSHPQALGQCREYIQKYFPNAQIVATLSTVAAVEKMRESEVIAAALAPARAAEIYDVNILAKGVQDHPNNETRFVVLGLEDHRRTGRDKTSLCFSFDEDRSGLLYSIMGEFALRNINLTKVESRPTKESLGRYIFLIDLEGHREDALIQEALAGLRLQTSRLKVFGSYPRFQG